MKNTLYHSLLSRLRNKHSKLASRFQKSIQDGEFQKQRYRKRKESIERLKGLERRIAGLGHQSGMKVSLNRKHWALALAMGVIMTAKAQEPASFKEKLSNQTQNTTLGDLPLASSIAPPVSLGTPYLADFHTGDIDGDGDIDAIYVSYVENPILIFNDGGFSFSQGEIPINTSGVIDETQLADFDGDGDLDFLARSGPYGSATFSVWENDGTGNFIEMPAVFPTFDIDFDKLRIGDIDGDGDADFVGESRQDVTPNYTYVTIFRNNSFDFTDTTALPGSYIFSRDSRFINLMDADGDTDLDILYTSYVVSYGNSIQVQENDGLGNFTDAGTANAITGLFFDEESAVLNFDNDGDFDLLVSVNNYPNASFYSFIGDGASGFADGSQTNVANNRDVDDLLATNINTDAFDDFVLNTQADSTFVFIGDGLGGFTDEAKFRGKSRPEDLDGDGDADLFLASGNVETLTNDGSQNFTPNGVLINISATYDVDLVDIDEDGDLDFVEGGEVISRIWENDGLGNFAISQEFEGDSYDMAFGDLDGDGDPDMVKALEQGIYPGFDIWTNEGGVLSYNSNLGSGNTKAKRIDLVTLDADADLDIVVYLEYGSPKYLRTFSNDGGLSFSQTNNFGLSHPVAEMEVADIDGDLDVDVVILYENAFYGVQPFLNDGTGNLGGTANISLSGASSQLTDIDFEDFDGDGDMDFLITSYNYNVIFSNNANDGTFTAGSPFADGVNSYKSSIGDVDEDGDIDIIFGGYISNPQIWENDGLGIFTFDATMDAIGDEYTKIIFGDLDADGDDDFAFGGGYVGTKIFFNQTIVAEPEINVQGNGLDVLTGDNTPEVADGTDLGPATIGTPPFPVSVFTIQNTGTSDLNVSSVTASGANAGDFIITNITTPATVGSASDVTFELSFIPSASGARTATIDIANDDTDEALYSFDVTGLGQTPQEINVQGGGIDIASGDTTPETTDGTDFGNVTIGLSSVFTFTIQNTGEADLDVSSISISGLNATDYAISNITTPAIVAGGGDVTFDVTFSPAASGARIATIDIANDDADEALYSFDITGLGQTEQEINVQGGGVDIASGDITPDLADGTDFGNVTVGQSGVFTFTIQNTGEADLDVSSIIVSGANASDYSISSITTPAIVSGGSDVTFDVTFTPPISGISLATIEIFNSDADESIYSFDVTGAGQTEQEINVQGGGIDIADGDTTPDVADGTDFGAVTVGQTGTFTFTIQNTGEADLNVNSIAIAGANAGDFAISNISTPTVVAGVTDITFDVIFTPSASGARTAIIDISSDDADEALYSFDITGLGQAEQEINVQGNEIDIVSGDTTPDPDDATDFGDVTIGQPVVITYVIENLGEADLTVSSIAFSGANSVDFTLASISTPAIINGGGNASFDIVFSPTAAGTRVATVTINNDDADEAAYTFDIAGFGQTPPDINIQGGGIDIVNGDTTPDPGDGTDFGTVIIGTTATNTFTIQNTGEANLNISSVGPLTGDLAQFPITNITTPVSVPGSTDVTFDVSYTPTAEVTNVVTIGILSDDIDEPLYTFDLTGVGLTDPLLVDSLAVVAFYNNNGGVDWTDNTNWLQEGQNLEDWFGVDLNAEGNRVEIISLPNNNISGTISNDLNTLDALESLDLSNNDIDGLDTDFSGLTGAVTINLDGNALDFADLEPVASAIDPGVISYANQQNLDAINETGPIEIPVGSSQTLTATVSGEANEYQWVLNGTDVAGETSLSINITDINRSNMGTYELKVTNSIASGVTLSSNPIDVLATAVISVDALDSDTEQGIPENVNAYLFEIIEGESSDTLDIATQTNVASTFSFPAVVLGNFIVAVESVVPLLNEDGTDNTDVQYLPTYFGNTFEAQLADTLRLNDDTQIQIVMTDAPPVRDETTGSGTVSGVIEDDFEDDASRIDARRRAARRKCGLKRRRSSGRPEQDDDEFELIAYGETNDNGEFEYGFLPSGTYRFFVEYPGVPLDESSFVQFDIGEAGVSDDSFTLAVFASPEGIQIELILGITSQFFTDFSIYPNPTSDVLFIEYDKILGDNLEMEIINMEGRTLMNRSIPKNQNRLQFDTSILSPGQYLIKFIDPKNTRNSLVYRLIKK